MKKNNNNNKIIIVIAVVLGVALIGFQGCDMFMNRIADKVIEKLEKEYSPSPYGPGLNPDRVDVNVFARPQQPAN